MSRKQQFARSHSVHLWLSPKTSQGRDPLSIRVRPPSIVWRWIQSSMPSDGLPQELTVRPHMPSSLQIQWACYKKWKVEWEAQTGLCRWSTSNFKNSCGYRYAGVKGNDRADRLEGKATITSDLCLGRSEVMRNLRQYLRAQATDVTPSIAWRREAWKEEALNDLPWEDERGPSSVRRTLEPFQRQRWGNFWETGWSAYGLFWTHRYHLELNWTTKTMVLTRVN